MDRRRFLAGALSALCAPSPAVAQADRVRRIGWLEFASSGEGLAIFERSMAGRGWISGQSFSLDYRGSDGKVDRLTALAGELARLPVDVMVAPGAPEALAAKSATKTVPIVMAGVDDPVARGLVASLAKPGRNVTGVAGARRELNERLLALIHELSPRAPRVAVLWVSTDPDHRTLLQELRVAARKVNLSLNAVEVQEYTDVEPAFATLKRQGSKVLVAPPSTMFVPRWIADLALTHGLALASTSPAYAYEGGLIACTDDRNAVFERAAAFVDRILKGAKPSELPVEPPAKFKLIVNARTARALKLVVPQSILDRADAVIG
jgi:putative ABC transport system substrate-binding protein